MNQLLEFFRNGTLGPVYIGATREAVRQKLGVPDDVSCKDDIWLYGDQGAVNVQVPFDGDTVNGIWIYLWGSTNTTSIATRFQSDGWKINGQSTMDDVTTILDTHSIGWTIEKEQTSEDQSCVLLHSGVRCLWSHDPETELEKIVY